MRPQRIFFLVIVGLAPLILFFLAKIAFTDAGMKQFEAATLGYIRWLRLSPDGRRAFSFAMLVIGIVGTIAVLKSIIARSFGLDAWGWVQVGIGLCIGAVGGFGWHVGHVALLWAIVMIITGCVLISKGGNNIRLGRWLKYFMS